MDEGAAWRSKEHKPELLNWEDCRSPGSKDPHARIEWMTEQGIDLAFLYPSLGLNWQTECGDAGLAAAYCRVYNDWIIDFCRPYPDRLIPIAMVSLMEVGERGRGGKTDGEARGEGRVHVSEPAG